MEQGAVLESEAIPFYEMAYDVNIRRVGYCSTDDMKIGCSPDGLIGENSGIEVKCPLPQTHLRYLLDGGLPKEYSAQVHGAMFVTKRPRWVFMSYCRKLPPLIVNVGSDQQIQAVLREALDGFLARFDAALERVKAMKEGA